MNVYIIGKKTETLKQAYEKAVSNNCDRRLHVPL